MPTIAQAADGCPVEGREAEIPAGVVVIQVSNYSDASTRSSRSSLQRRMENTP